MASAAAPLRPRPARSSGHGGTALTPGAPRRGWRRFFRNNGLSLTLLAFFILTLGFGQFLTGWHEYNHDRAERKQPLVTLGAYATSPHFLEATAENWESEFFQMFVYVTLTVFLFQKGSAESNDPDNPHQPEPRLTARSPWAARQGGWIRRLYEHSLSLALATMFVVSFSIHAFSGARLLNEESLAQGDPPVTVLQYVGTSRFWFESFQNWQSEFLAIGLMVVLSIFLREKDSPESKPVNLPHDEHE